MTKLFFVLALVATLCFGFVNVTETKPEFERVRVTLPSQGIDTEFWSYTSYLPFHLEKPVKVHRYDSGVIAITYRGMEYKEVKLPFLYGYDLIVDSTGKEALSIIERLFVKDTNENIENHYYLFGKDGKPGWVPFYVWLGWAAGLHK